MEIADFAAALRGMADNVDVLAERHDVTQMAQLRREVADLVVKNVRQTDLVDELRRHVEVMGRSLDGIGRLRKSVLTGDRPADVVQVLADALLILDGPCEIYTGSSTCRNDPGRSRRAAFTADAWCASCIARDALQRVGFDLVEQP